MKRFDPTTLPGFRMGYAPPWKIADPDSVGVAYYTDRDNLVVHRWDVGNLYGEEWSFTVPLDVLTEEQVIEILRRNGCPVPGEDAA